MTDKPSNIRLSPEAAQDAAVSVQTVKTNIRPSSDGATLMVEAGSFIVYGYNPTGPRAQQASWVTILSVWNSSLGTSILLMSWGISKSGLFYGFLLILFVCSVCVYTANLLLKLNNEYSVTPDDDLSDLIEEFLGYKAVLIAEISLVFILMSTVCVFFLYLCNMIYIQVNMIHDMAYSGVSLSMNPSLLCLSALKERKAKSSYELYWNLKTHPIFVGAGLLCIISIKNLKIFFRFGSLGVLNVCFYMILMIVKANSWGFNIPDYREEFKLKATSVYVPGVITFACGLHHVILMFFKESRNPKKNVRDCTISFALAATTYCILGGIPYSTFPLDKSCINPNILNNFKDNDVIAVGARFLLMFQLLTLFPLQTYLLRVYIFRLLDRQIVNYTRRGLIALKRTAFNFTVIFICVLVAMFFPNIGGLVRITGAFAGFVYVFGLPCIIKIMSLKRKEAHKSFKIVLPCVVILLGAMNLINQFLG